MLDWFHIGMRLQHLKQVGNDLSCGDPARVAAKAVIVAEVERPHWRLWNGKATNTRISIDPIRAVVHHFKGEAGTGKSIAPSGEVVDCLARAGWLSDRSERVAGQLRQAAPGRIEGWHRDHRRDSEFPGEPPDEQMSADAVVATRCRSAASGPLRCL